MRMILLLLLVVAVSVTSIGTINIIFRILIILVISVIWTVISRASWTAGFIRASRSRTTSVIGCVMSVPLQFLWSVVFVIVKIVDLHHFCTIAVDVVVVVCTGRQ